VRIRLRQKTAGRLAASGTAGSTNCALRCCACPPRSRPNPSVSTQPGPCGGRQARRADLAPVPVRSAAAV